MRCSMWFLLVSCHFMSCCVCTPLDFKRTKHDLLLAVRIERRGFNWWWRNAEEGSSSRSDSIDSNHVAFQDTPAGRWEIEVREKAAEEARGLFNAGEEIDGMSEEGMTVIARFGRRILDRMGSATNRFIQSSRSGWSFVQWLVVSMVEGIGDFPRSPRTVIYDGTAASIRGLLSVRRNIASLGKGTILAGVLVLAAYFGGSAIAQHDLRIVIEDQVLRSTIVNASFTPAEIENDNCKRIWNEAEATEGAAEDQHGRPEWEKLWLEFEPMYHLGQEDALKQVLTNLTRTQVHPWPPLPLLPIAPAQPATADQNSTYQSQLERWIDVNFLVIPNLIQEINISYQDLFMKETERAVLKRSRYGDLHSKDEAFLQLHGVVKARLALPSECLNKVKESKRTKDRMQYLRPNSRVREQDVHRAVQKYVDLRSELTNKREPNVVM